MKWNTNTVTEEPAKELISVKDGPHRVLWERTHIAIVDVNEIHNVVSIDRITLARTKWEAIQATGTEVDLHDDAQWKAGGTRNEFAV